MTTEISKWERPENLKIPTVWRKFEGRLEMPDGNKPKFIIQDMTEEYIEDALKLCVEITLKESIIANYLKLKEDPISMKEMVESWMKAARGKAALLALLDDGSTRKSLAGISLTYVLRKQDKSSPNDYKGAVMKAIARDVKISNFVNVFDHFGLNEYLASHGLFVREEYRGQGLGVELLKTRIPLGKALGLKVSVTNFTTVKAKIVAEKAGMEVLAEIEFTSIKSEGGKKLYSILNPKTMKIMALRIE